LIGIKQMKRSVLAGADFSRPRYPIGMCACTPHLPCAFQNAASGTATDASVLRIWTGGSEEQPMEQFYFHVTRNGIRTSDNAGLSFPDRQGACDDALQKMPDLLNSTLKSRSTYVTIEICDASDTLCVVRGSIRIEHWQRTSAH
jgi:hypothetical protein